MSTDAVPAYVCDTEGHRWCWLTPVEGGELVATCSVCHRITTSRRDAVADDLAEVLRLTLASVRGERDSAQRLLRVLRTLGYVPDGALGRAVNCAVALESEDDIEDARREVDEWIMANLPDEPPFKVAPTVTRADVDRWLFEHNQVRVSRHIVGHLIPPVEDCAHESEK